MTDEQRKRFRQLLMQGTNWLQIEKRMHGNLAITVRMDGQTIEISQEDLAVAKAQLTLLGKLRNL